MNSADRACVLQQAGVDAEAAEAALAQWYAVHGGTHPSAATFVRAATASACSGCPLLADAPGQLLRLAELIRAGRALRSELPCHADVLDKSYALDTRVQRGGRPHLSTAASAASRSRPTPSVPAPRRRSRAL